MPMTMEDVIGNAVELALDKNLKRLHLEVEKAVREEIVKAIGNLKLIEKLNSDNGSGHQLLKTKEAAQYIGMSPAWLVSGRCECRLEREDGRTFIPRPPCIRSKHSKTWVRYDKIALDKWLMEFGDESRRQTEEDEGSC